MLLQSNYAVWWNDTDGLVNTRLFDARPLSVFITPEEWRQHRHKNTQNKKAELSQRRPRDAPYTWVPWKKLFNFCRSDVSAIQGYSMSLIDFGTDRKAYATSYLSVVVILVIYLAPCRRFCTFCVLLCSLLYPNFGGVPVAPERPCWLGQQAHKP